MNVYSRVARVFNGGAKISEEETHDLKGSHLKTVWLADPRPILEYYSGSATQLDELSTKSKGHLYLMKALRFAENPTVTRKAGRYVNVGGEIRVPVAAALGVPTTSGVGDVGASAQTGHSRSQTSISTAEGDQAFAASYIHVVVNKGIIKRSPPELASKGTATPCEGNVTLFAGSTCGDVEDEENAGTTYYIKPSLKDKAI